MSVTRTVQAFALGATAYELVPMAGPKYHRCLIAPVQVLYEYSKHGKQSGCEEYRDSQTEVDVFAGSVQQMGKQRLPKRLLASYRMV